MQHRIHDWKDLDSNFPAIFDERLDRLQKIRAQGNGGWKRAFAYYQQNPIDAIEDWVSTYDPRRTGSGQSTTMPFILYPKQKDMVRWWRELYEDQEEGTVEKSREVGASWVFLCCSWWLWTFHDGVKISWGSNKLEQVDNLGDPDSLFEKFRMIVRRVPVELRPLGYNEDKHALFRRLINEERGNRMIGQGGKDIGRGGRSSCAIVDEAAFLEDQLSAEAALSANTECRVWLSTVNGPSNRFFTRRFESDPKRVFIFDWRDDPRKDQAWYERQKAKLDPMVLAQEVDRNYDAAAGDTVILSAQVKDSQFLRKHLRAKGLLPKVKDGDGIGGLDIATGGPNSTVFCPRYGPLVGDCIAWDDDDSINIAERTQRLAKRLMCRSVNYDTIGVGKGMVGPLRRIKNAKGTPVNVGSPPTNRVWPDGVKSKKRFVNLKAELWWTARERLRNASEWWLFIETGGKKGREHLLADVLLLPDDRKLAMELPLPLYHQTETGKIQIEAKKHMVEVRKIPSTDYADAFILTLAPERRTVGSNRTEGMV